MAEDIGRKVIKVKTLRHTGPKWMLVATPRHGGSDIIFVLDEEEHAQELLQQMKKGKYPNINMQTCSRIEIRRIDEYTVWSRVDDTGHKISGGRYIDMGRKLPGDLGRCRDDWS